MVARVEISDPLTFNRRLSNEYAAYAEAAGLDSMPIDDRLPLEPRGTLFIDTEQADLQSVDPSVETPKAS